MRLVPLLLALATCGALLSPSSAQGQTAAAASAGAVTPPSYADGRLTPGQTFTDAHGRRVENTGLTNGSVNIRYTGTVRSDGRGNYTCSGDIVKITLPASGGSDAFVVNTNGEPTEIDVQRNGLSGNPNNVTVSGGRASVNVGGNFNDVSVGGTNNTVTFRGNNNTGAGQPGSGGTTWLYGRGNAWNGSAGNWTIRN